MSVILSALVFFNARLKRSSVYGRPITNFVSGNCCVGLYNGMIKKGLWSQVALVFSANFAVFQVESS